MCEFNIFINDIRKNIINKYIVKILFISSKSLTNNETTHGPSILKSEVVNVTFVV